MVKIYPHTLPPTRKPQIEHPLTVSHDQHSYSPSKRDKSLVNFCDCILLYILLSQSAVSGGDRKPCTARRELWAADHHCLATGRFWPQFSVARMRYFTAPECWYPNSGFWRRLIALEGKNIIISWRFSHNVNNNEMIKSPLWMVYNLLGRVFSRKILGDLSEWTIQLGMTRRHSHSFFGRKVKVEKIIRHEMYNNGPVQHDHDIALFKVTYKYYILW